MDFTISEYEKLLDALKAKNYSFKTIEEFIIDSKQKQIQDDKVVALRHDVDERPHNALKLAEVEYKKGIKATYYFRIVKISNDPVVIKKIAALGHEIGYHYEDLALANGDFELAINSFSKNLAYFRTYYPVKTVCMHGSSMSDYDNRDMWKKYSLTAFEIIGEPYLSIDYSNILYITDTGRCWDGNKYSIRDYVKSDEKHVFHSTQDIISGVNKDNIPNKVIIQSHTLWTDSFKEWIWLYFREKIRNNSKVIIVKFPFIKRIGYKLIKLYSK